MSTTESEIFESFKRAYEEVRYIEMLNDTILQLTELLDKYRAIGTVSEFRELKEKATERYSEEDAPDGYGHTCTNKTCAERIRAKAIEEFAEKMKELFKHIKVADSVIDMVVKEMKGE